MLMLLTSRFSGSSRRTASLLVLAALCAGAPAQAQAQVYKCVDQNGATLYTDRSARGCVALDLPSTIPAPAQRGATAAPRAAAPVTTPSDFPRVASAQQRARDDDRREILNDELRNEEKKLAELRREFNNGEPERQGNEKNYAKYQERVAQMRDSIGRAEKNVEALKREIANIR